MKIGFLTCIWKRHDLFVKYAKHLNYIQSKFPEINFINIAVGSEGNISKRISVENNIKYTEYDNMPLGAKWNSGLKAFKKYNCDYIICMGSDDFLCETTLENYIKYCNMGYDLIGLVDCFFYETKSNTLAYWGGYINDRKNETIGLGRCISKKLLKELDYQLWDFNITTGLDGSMWKKLKNFVYTEKKMYLFDFGGIAVDVKDGTNITAFELYKNTTLFDENYLFKKIKILKP